MSDQQSIATALDALQPQMAREARRISELIISRHALEIVSLYRADRIHAPSEGRAALVATAGVPGAGKSSFVEENLDVGRYFHIDPDKVRVHCLEIAKREGYLDQWLHRRLPDGQPPRLGELSTLVQRASTSISDSMRDIALNNRENIIMEGTLQWAGHPNAYLGDPDRPNVPGLLTPGRGYGGFEVYAVEVPERVALEQASNRWWEKREVGSELARYMPPRAIQGMYPQPGRKLSVDDVARQVRTERGRSLSHVDKPADRAAQQKEIRERVQRQVEAKKGSAGPKPPNIDPPSQRGWKL